jgi:hypothetical protein
MNFFITAPGPNEKFTEVDIKLAEVGIWYHVYCTEQYPSAADSFNLGWGDTRFAPLMDARGCSIHTYYAASTPECAFMESVLHDVPLAPPGYFEVDRLVHYRLATLKLRADLKAVSFHTPYLPKLNLNRGQLIDSLPAYYKLTRVWAQAAYLQVPDAQAITYCSRRDDSARCIMLFGQRLTLPAFDVIADEPLATGVRRAEILTLVRRLDIHEI